MKSFIMADKFIAEAEARHEAAVLEPNIAQKEPEKKMPSTAANAILCSMKLALAELHHLRAQLALCWTHGIVSIA